VVPRPERADRISRYSPQHIRPRAGMKVTDGQPQRTGKALPVTISVTSQMPGTRVAGNGVLSPFDHAIRVERLSG
jgi:hypothetical protein